MKKTRRKVERALIEETAKIYHSIVHNSMDGFWIVDMRGTLLDVNNVYCRMIGYSRSELLQMNASDIEVKKKQKDIVKQYKHIKKTGTERFFTQHRKKDGTIVDIEITANYADHLGGLIFVALRNITETRRMANNQYKHRATSRKKIEGQLADSYQHSQDQIASRKKIEGQLTDSYKHLGTINRKISLLLELEDFPKSKKRNQEVIDHILNMAISISGAPIGYLYCAKGRGRFNLLSSQGCNEEQKEKIKIITSHKVGLLKKLLGEKKVISGDIRRYEADLLVMDNKLEYFITLPLLRETALGGFIFLGFDKKHTMSTQDLEFLDVFSMHTSKALAKVGVFDKKNGRGIF